MCGIAGIVSSHGCPDRDVLTRMARCMAHRGPDGEAVWTDGPVGFAFRRLAIIDLAERSMQPLHLDAWHLVFNGEIYNYRELRDSLRDLGHRFQTEGDAEVLLHAWDEWGEEALDRLDGMFAFAIWNDELRELVCASDPFGEKPLYWAWDGKQFLFASDIRALLMTRPELGSPRQDALAPFVGRGLMPAVDDSFFADVHRLPGSHLLRLSDGTARVRRYWRPRRVKTPERYDIASEQLQELLVASIRRRLRADVPVGTSLSGGVDSSCIVGLAAAIAGNHRRHGFTATFPAFDRDEWSYASDVAAVAGVVEHHAVRPTSAGCLDELEQVVRAQEEPFGSASIYAQWCVMRAAREAGIPVLLDGQGADEIFGGYAGSNGWAVRSMGLGAVATSLLSRRDRRAVLEALGSRYVPERTARRYRRSLVTPYATDEVADAAARVVPPDTWDGDLDGPLSHELVRQCFHTSLPALLRYADRDSMAHGVEVRLPFLDRAVAEFGLSLPASFVYRNGVRKAILRDAVRGIVPDQVLDSREKIGFEPPQAAWLVEPDWIERIEEVLLDPRSIARGLVRADVVEQDARAKHWRDPSGIWRMLSVELWLNAFDGASSRS